MDIEKLTQELQRVSGLNHEQAFFYTWFILRRIGMIDGNNNR